MTVTPTTPTTPMPAVAPLAAADLEELFGDPFDPGNPTGHDAVLAADDAGVPLAAGERLLDGWAAGAEYVPAELGGRLTDVDRLVRRLRPVFRRDAALGLGHGLTSLMAALPVWAAGDPEQCRRLAGLLRSGGKVSVAFHELAHGNDLTRNALRADPTTDGRLCLHGEKQVINNAGRAAAALVFARTGSDPGREHSLLLLDDLAGLDGNRFRRLPRFRTSGLAGCQLAGLAFDGCPVDRASMVGDQGAGAAIALRAFQVSRCVTAGAGTSLLEGSLYAALRFAGRRRLYGRTVAELPHARALLVGAFVDLQVAQALASTAARALQLLPAVAGRWAAATKYLVPRLVEDALADLAVVLGARSYLREGEYAVVGKHLRDVAGLSIGHAGGTSCQLTVLPELPGLDPTGAPAPDALFDATPLPALELSGLRLRGSRRDPLLASLTALAGELADADGPAAGPAAELLAEQRSLLAAAAALPPAERGTTAGHRSLALTERYAWLLAAAACLGRHAAGDGLPGSEPWIRAALLRIARRSDRAHGPQPTELDDALITEMTGRADRQHSLDLDPDPVVRSPL